jgi:hypothetical protein
MVASATLQEEESPIKMTTTTDINYDVQLPSPKKSIVPEKIPDPEPEIVNSQVNSTTIEPGAYQSVNQI